MTWTVFRTNGALACVTCKPIKALTFAGLNPTNTPVTAFGKRMGSVWGWWNIRPKLTTWANSCEFMNMSVPNLWLCSLDYLLALQSGFLIVARSVAAPQPAKQAHVEVETTQVPWPLQKLDSAHRAPEAQRATMSIKTVVSAVDSIGMWKDRTLRRNLAKSHFFRPIFRS